MRNRFVHGDTQRAIEILDNLMNDEVRKSKHDEQKKSFAAIQMMKMFDWSAEDIAIAKEYNQNLKDGLL